MGESKDLGQCTHDGDLAVAPLRTRHNVNPIDKRADGLENLRACCLMLQRLLEFRDLPAVEVWKVRVDRDLHGVLLGPQISIDLSLASLQALQLIAHGAGVAVTTCYEVEAAPDAALHILQFF